MKNKKPDRLTKGEKEILESLDRNEWKSVINKSSRKAFTEYAQNTLVKDKRINIRMNEKDLKKLKAKAAEEGIPYQTLISSLIHKYVTGKIVEAD